MSPSETVYFIQAGEGGPIKIGVSANVNHRLQMLQSANPAKLRLLGTVPGGRSVERQLYEALGDFRLMGEWFQDGPEVRAMIADPARLDASPKISRNRYRAARLKTGLTQRELAERTGVSQAFIANLEGGLLLKRPRRSYNYMMVCSELGLEPSE